MPLQTARPNPSALSSATIQVDGTILSSLLARRMFSLRLRGVGEVQVFDVPARDEAVHLFIAPDSVRKGIEPEELVREHVERHRGAVEDPVGVWTMTIGRAPASLLVGALALEPGAPRRGVLAEFAPGGDVPPWPSPEIARALGRLLTDGNGDRAEVLERIDRWCDANDAHPPLHLVTRIDDEPVLYRWSIDEASGEIHVGLAH